MIPRTGGACMMREVDGKKRGGVCTYEVSCCAAFPLGGGVLSMAQCKPLYSLHAVRNSPVVVRDRVTCFLFALSSCCCWSCDSWIWR